MFAAIDLRYAARCLLLRALKRIALVALPLALAIGAYVLLR
jgi:hypothetical protein